MKTKLLLAASLMILGISGLSVALDAAPQSSALTYQNTANVQFTFSSSMTISFSDLTDNTLAIGSVAPGQVGQSADTTITVSSNGLYGYYLSATVGSNTTGYGNAYLVHETASPDTAAARFTNLATDASLSAANITSGYWGYSTDSGTTYSGLPVYSGTAKTIDTKTTAGTGTTKFRIGAKAANGQLSGTYTNTINFYITPRVTES